MGDRHEDSHVPARRSANAEGLIDRRGLIKSAAVLAGGAAASALMSGSSEAQGNNQPQRILIRGGRIISMDSAVGDFDTGDVLIEKGAITSVGRNLSASGATVINAANKLVLPGLIDGHRHGWMQQLRSSMVTAPFLDFIVKTMQPTYRPEDAYAGTLLGCVDSLNAGITTMFDFSHIMSADEMGDAVIKAHKESGMRVVVGYTLPHLPVSENALDGARRFHKKYFAGASDPLLTFAGGVRIGNANIVNTFGPGIGVPWDNAVHDIKIGRELGAKRLHFHAISVKMLSDAKLLGPDLSFVHAGGQSDDDIKMVGDSGGTVVLTAVGEGPTSTRRFLKGRVPVSIGIDDGPGNPCDLFIVMRTLLKNDRNVERQLATKEKREPELMTWRTALEAATINGAKAVGLEDKVGSLSPGKRADVIMVDLDNLSYPIDKDPLPGILSQATGNDVSWVIVEGQIKKRDGKLVGDRARVKKLAQDSYDYLIQKANLPANT